MRQDQQESVSLASYSSKKCRGFAYTAPSHGTNIRKATKWRRRKVLEETKQGEARMEDESRGEMPAEQEIK